MKKSIIALMGLFTLVACSEDVYQEIDEQNTEPETQYSTNSFDDNYPGHYEPGDIWWWQGGNNDTMQGYVTPWDIWYRNQTQFRPQYIFTNGGEGGISPYIMKVTPYIGLAYYDDIEDGDYTDLLTNTIVANLSGGNFPNLYANGYEAGNLIRCQPIEMLGNGTPGESEAAIGSSVDHMPLDTSPFGSGYNPQLKRFRVLGMGNLTSQEYQLLLDYGKVFYYHVELLSKTPGNPVVFATDIQLENQSLNVFGNPLWRQLPYMSPVPGFGQQNLFYYKSVSGSGTQWQTNPANVNPGSVECDSREIVFGKFTEHRINLPASLGGGYIIMDTSPGTSLWQNAGIYLSYRP